jgi:hypothetical protein
MRTPLYNAYDTFNRKSPVLHSADSNQEPKGGIPMNDQELFKQVLKWSYHHCPNLWKEYYFNAGPEKRKQVARKILIEKVKKEPDTELLISPALKEKILLKEGVDLKQINNEHQEKKGYFKEKKETKLINQEPVEDSDIDEDEIINLILSDQLKKEWNKFRWYSIPSIASNLGIHRNTVVYWRDFGIKVNGSNIRLKMVKRPFKWYSKGKWIIEFFLKTNADVDMD